MSTTCNPHNPNFLYRQYWFVLNKRHNPFVRLPIDIGPKDNRRIYCPVQRGRVGRRYRPPNRPTRGRSDNRRIGPRPCHAPVHKRHTAPNHCYRNRSNIPHIDNYLLTNKYRLHIIYSLPHCQTRPEISQVHKGHTALTPPPVDVYQWDM